MICGMLVLAIVRCEFISSQSGLVQHVPVHQCSFNMMFDIAETLPMGIPYYTVYVLPTAVHSVRYSKLR